MKVIREKSIQGLIVALELPDTPLASVEDAPQLKVGVETIKLGAYQLPEAFLEQTVSKVGIYLADHPDEPVENGSIFRAEHAADLIYGRYAKDGWLPYGFIATPTTLRIDFYNIQDPCKCGLVELGRNFHQLWVKVGLPGDLAETILRFEGSALISMQPLPNPALIGATQYWNLNCIRATCTESKAWGFSKRKYVQGILDANCYAGVDPNTLVCSYNLLAKDHASEHVDQVDI